MFYYFKVGMGRYQKFVHSEVANANCTDSRTLQFSTPQVNMDVSS